MRDLANGFDEHGYSLNGNAVTVTGTGKLVSGEGQTPSDAIRKLAWIIEESGYTDTPITDLTPLAGLASLRSLILKGTLVDVEPLAGLQRNGLTIIRY